MSVSADTDLASSGAVKAVFGNEDNAKDVIAYLAEYEVME